MYSIEKKTIFGRPHYLFFAKNLRGKKSKLGFRGMMHFFKKSFFVLPEIH